MLKRYNWELDYSGCYYEGDYPDIMGEESRTGQWVKFSDLEDLFLQEGFALSLLEGEPKTKTGL